LRTLPMGARAFIPLAIAGAFIFALAPTTPASAASPRSTEAQQIIRVARKQVGDRYRYGASGPSSFDCSGLVIYAYRKAGDARVVGRGKYRSARALYRYFQRRGLASRSNPRPGDIVVWGRGTHVGIYIGGGKAISALTSGVRVHGVHAVRAPFTAYLHTGMSGTRAKASTSRHHASTSSKVRYTRGAVNLRRGPSVRRSRIRTLPNHARLTVLGRSHDGRGRVWLKVRAAGRTGYVLRSLTR
jgi:NlpC/P60 family/Bacterial SH3 domain